MESSVKSSRTLRGFLFGYLLRTAAACLAVLLAWLVLLLGLISAGVVLPAYTGSDATLQAMEQLSTMSADHFDAAALPALCRWVLLSEQVTPGSPATVQEVLATNMTSSQLSLALALGSPLRYQQFYRDVPLIDGTLCRLQYDFATPYADPALRGVLPDFQISMLVLLCLLLAGVALLMTRRNAKRLQEKTRQLTQACRVLAGGDLSVPMPGGTGIRELDEALQTMEGLRHELAASLRTQWAMEQQRTNRMAALAHDLKTPLTVVQGNAELLAEDRLSAGQRASVEAILRGTEQAGRYLTDLQTACRLQVSPTPAEDFLLDVWMQSLAQTARGLCQTKEIRLTCRQEGCRGLFLWGRQRELTRAVENLLANGVRFTPPGGSLLLEALLTEGGLQLTVEDTGPGFSSRILRNGGQMFVTGDEARGDGHQGLGLYVARTVAETHGGELLLANTGTGARATIQLPRSLLRETK